MGRFVKQEQQEPRLRTKSPHDGERLVNKMIAQTIKNTTQRVYSLRHIETSEYICLLQDGVDYLACFTDGDTALEFRTELGLQEHVDVFVSPLDTCPFTHFWLDGEYQVAETPIKN